MKNIFPLILICVSILISSCDRQQANITDPSDYESAAYLSARNSRIENQYQSMAFWNSRFEKNPNDFVALERLASFYSAAFKMTGRMEDLNTSDSLFHVILKNPAYQQAGIFRSLAANCISRHAFWKAKAHLREAIALGENKAASLLLLADVMIELGNVDSARVILKNFTNKNTFSWLIREAKVLDHEGMLDSAITTMEKAHDLVKMNDELFCWSKSNLGDLYGHAGRINESYNAYIEVLQREPGYDYARQRIAWIAYAHDGDSAEARQILLDLIKRKPLPDYFLLLSEVSEKAGNTPLAEKYSRIFLQKASSSKYGDMYNRHLITYYAERDTRLAMKLARRELQVRPTPESYDLLAWTLLKNGNLNGALDIAREYVEGRSHEPEVLMHLGEIYANIDKEKSRSYLELALESSFEIGPAKSREIQLILSGL